MSEDEREPKCEGAATHIAGEFWRKFLKIYHSSEEFTDNMLAEIVDLVRLYEGNQDLRQVEYETTLKLLDLLMEGGPTSDSRRGRLLNGIVKVLEEYEKEHFPI